MPNCTCGVKLRLNNARGTCATCLRARKCIDCGGKVSRISTGRCGPCSKPVIAKDPERRAKASASVRKRYADPNVKLRHAEGLMRWRANMPDATRESLRASSREIGRRTKNLVSAHSPEVRAKAWRTRNAHRYVPPEYRDHYRYLRETKRYSADEAFAMVSEQVRVDMKRYLATGKLQASI